LRKVLQAERLKLTGMKDLIRRKINACHDMAVTDEEETVGDRIHGTFIGLMAASIELDEEIYSDSGTSLMRQTTAEARRISCSFGGSMVKPILQSVIICHHESWKKEKKKL
jgi:hypothetical protein